jgi:FkbM family methyltransferase
MKSILNKLLLRIGYEVRRKQLIKSVYALEMLAELRNSSDKETNEAKFFRYALENITTSRSQIFQDLFVLYSLGEKRDGYFVEFGAGNGEFLSNTVVLERSFGWRGIVAEPGRNSHQKLNKSRRCIIDLRCVWNETGKQLLFSESSETELSTLVAFKQANDAQASKEYRVETVSLNDLLSEHSAPAEMDYLSIDTEGSELDILKAFDFSRYKFSVITVEHNYRRDREDIFHILTGNGYKRVLETITMFDDWYVLNAD